MERHDYNFIDTRPPKFDVFPPQAVLLVHFAEELADPIDIGMLGRKKCGARRVTCLNPAWLQFRALEERCFPTGSARDHR